MAGATNAIVEYIGPGARTLSATGKATITNMGAELGATTSMFPADERMLRYLRATGRGDLGRWSSATASCSSRTREVEAEPERYYDRVLELDLSGSSRTSSGRTRPTARGRSRSSPTRCATAKNAFRDGSPPR